MIVESYEDTILLSGELTSDFWETIHTAISLTLKRHPTGVVIDCSGITKCTPQGAETFRRAMEFIEKHDARIIVAAVPPHVLEVLRAVPDVRSQLPVADTVEDARRSLDLLVSDEATQRKKKANGKVVKKVLLVCLTGEASDQYLLDVAIEIAEPMEAKVCLVYPVVVPRDLPVQAPMLQHEEVGAKVLGDAAKKLQNAQIQHEVRLERGRDVAGAIHGVLQDVAASQVLVALPTEEDLPDQTVKLVKSILGKIQQPVLLVRAGIEPSARK